MFLCLFIFEVFVSRCPIRQEPNSFTYSLQIYCIGLIFQIFLQIVTLQGLLTSLLPLIINTLINQYTHNNFLFVKQFMGYK